MTCRLETSETPLEFAFVTCSTVSAGSTADTRKVENVEIRQHKTVLYSSIYRADDQLIVNQHAYGISAAHAPVFCLRGTEGGETAALYFESFEHVWATAMPFA